MFHYLEAQLTSRLQKRDNNWRKALPVGLNLGLTLCYLATGIESQEMHNSWYIGYSTVDKVDSEVCNAIIDSFQDVVLKTSENVDKWKAVAWCFEERWNLHHCLGAVDGKHYKIS